MPRIFHFADYEVNLGAGQLYKRGVRISLRDQSFQVLALLLEHAGETVSRAELRRRLWPEDVFVDFDNNLNTAIARLREALSDRAEHPRFIETLPKRGYRFIARVSEPPRLPHALTPKSKLVVLPFANLSGDPAQEYFSDAMTDEVITELARLAPEHLGVIARTTALRYKSSHKDIFRISHELSVDYIVEGSVRRADDRIGINVQLIRSSDQMHLWAERYDVDLREILGMQRAIAQAIATRLEIPPAHAATKPSVDVTTYNLYIQGRYHLSQWTRKDVATAKECFEKAIGRSPRFAPAYASLAELHYLLGVLGFVSPKEAFTSGIWAALQAVEVDQTLAETHALLGQFRKQLDYDWQEAHREMRLALELNPASPEVQLRYAVGWLMPHGRIGDAISELRRALEADPLSLFARLWLGSMLWLGRLYDQAIAQARLMLELDSAYHLGHFLEALIHREEGRFEEAIAAQHRAVELSGGTPVMRGWLGLAIAQSGNTAEARIELGRLHEMARKTYVSPTSFAWIYLGLGEIDEFFTWMDRAIDERDHMLMPIKTYPFLDPIRSDQRYLALLHKMNLSD